MSTVLLMRSATLLLFFLQIALPKAAVGQVAPPAILKVQASRPVGPVTSFPLVEPHLSIDPRRPAHWIAAAMAPDSALGTECQAYASFDAGQSWTVSRRGGPRCADVWTATLRDGTALLSFGDDSGWAVVRSPDGGRRWNDVPAHIRGAHDHVMLLVDGADAIYLVSGLATRNATRERRSVVYVARSRDAGVTFVERGRAILSNTSYEAQTPVILRDSTLIVPTIDHHDASYRPLDRRRSQIVASTDAGATFGEPMLVTESCSRTRYTSWPVLAVVEMPAAHAERLVYACEAEGNHGILFARSDDRGNRWTAVTRIDGGTDSARTKVPMLAVSADGMLAVAWLDGRDDQHLGCWQLYVIVSLDGGETFTRPTRLSDAPSCATAAANGAHVFERFPSGGEYFGMVSASPGTFVVVWPDARSGLFQLRSVTFSLDNTVRNR